jgi:glycosyltransferase involved in cell wall biosynthesis
MRIGISRSGSTPADGGIFCYETVFLKALSEIATRFPEELVYLTYKASDLLTLANEGGLNYRGLPIQPVPKLSPQRAPPEAYISQKPTTPPPLDLNTVKFDTAGAELFREAGIDLLLLLSPSVNAFAFRLPFVVPIFDLNHRLQPEFPEVSDFGEANFREYFYINVCRFATLVLVDSEAGKADVLRFYGHLIDEDRIRILPYYPPIERKAMPDRQERERVRAKYSLPQRYFFYPASFWRHKNHQLILNAQKLIADETGEVVPVVFCGTYHDYFRAQNFKEAVALAMKLGIADRVRYLGLVPEEDKAALYTSSAGLVMPTFFGPTNIPPLEAWYYGRPVITSDIPGIREQIGDAGLLVNPRSAPDLAQAMLRLWKDETLAAQLAERGRQRLASYSWDSFITGVTAIMTEACERVRAGRTPRYPDLNPA